jgi:hypothetical protein
VFSHNVVLFAQDRSHFFAILQSRVHEVFAAFFSSTLEDRLGYRPADCFETFPFPPAWQAALELEKAGAEYYEYRATLMASNGEGLTKTYNRFHDPDESSPGIVRLRALHDAMDRSVLDSYGWTDLHPACENLLDYEEEDNEDDDSGRTRQRKKPWRYRWTDDFRDEVLARLLALNQRRAADEHLAGGRSAAGKSAKMRRPSKLG